MKALTAAQIQGTWATLLLPLNCDESIDFLRLSDQIDRLLASRVDGIYTNGTSGEFYAQSEGEFDRLHQLLAEKCETAGRPFQIGASHLSPQISLQRVRRAAALRPGAIQAILPDWTPPHWEECLDFLKRLAEAAAPIGLVLYNPPQARKVLAPGEYGRLRREIPSLVGIKVGPADRSWYREMELEAPGLSIFVPGHHLATGLSRGASGSYSNVACLQPSAAKSWNRLMLSDPEAAGEIERRLQAFFAEHLHPLGRLGYSSQAIDKLLAGIGGWCDIGTRLRWPYRSLSLQDCERLRQVAARQIPEFIEAISNPLGARPEA